MHYGLNEAQIALQARARELAESVIAPRAAEVDRNEQYPWDNVAGAARRRIYGYDDPNGERRRRPHISGCCSRHRGDGEGVWCDRPHQRGSEHGCHIGGNALWNRRAA